MTDFDITQLAPIPDAQVTASVIIPVVNPADTTTPPANADGSNQRMTIGQLIPTIWVPPPTGVAATDTANIQNTINASSAGDTIGFRGGTPYDVDARIVYLGDRKYVGEGVAKSSFGATIRQAAGTNLGSGLPGGAFEALFADSVWAAGSGGSVFCDDPVVIANLCIDVNEAANASSVCAGIAAINFWSEIRDCQVQNTAGADGHGIVLTDTCFSGAVITNGASQNRVCGNQVINTASDGLRQICANGVSNLDGFAIDNIFDTIGGSAINFDSAAGWKIAGNHIYGIQDHGINLATCFATRVTGNYIEDFGGAAASGQFYAGIGIAQLDGRGSFVQGNFVSCAEPGPSAGGYQYIAVSSGFGEADAQVTVTGNKVHGPASPTTQGTGLVYQVGGGGADLTIVSDDNDVVSVNTPAFIGAGVTFGADAANPPFSPGGTTMTGYLAPAVVPLTASGSTVAVNAALGNAFDYAPAASTTISNPANLVDGQVIRFRITSGGSHTTSWDTDYDFGAGSAPTLSATAGKIDIVAFESVAGKLCCLNNPGPY